MKQVYLLNDRDFELVVYCGSEGFLSERTLLQTGQGKLFTLDCNSEEIPFIKFWEHYICLISPVKEELVK